MALFVVLCWCLYFRGQFGNPGIPSFLGDAGYFMFDFKGLLWSFMVPVVVAAAMLAAAGRDVFVCGDAPFAWLCPTCFQPPREPPLRDAMLAALVVSLLYFLVQTEGYVDHLVCISPFCQAIGWVTGILDRHFCILRLTLRHPHGMLHDKA